MKKLMIIILLLFMISFNARANDFKIGYVHNLNPHSAAPGKCLDTGDGMSFAFDLTLDKYKILKLDLGLQMLLLNFTEFKRDCVGCLKTDEKARQSINLTPYLKPTINIWRFSFYGLCGLGFDYINTQDGSDHVIMYGHGIDFEIDKDILISIEKQEIIRADSGRYRLPVVAMIKFKF